MTWALKAKPYAVQIEALKRSAGRTGFGFLLEMGLGKTAVTIAEYLHLWPHVEHMIVVCPNSLKSTWAEECQKMGAEAALILWPRIVSTFDVRKATVAPITVINYEAVITMRGRRHLTQLLQSLRCMLVLDESINIKNYKARRTKELIALGQFAHVKRILSGAPVVQGPHDLWAQLRFINAMDMNYFAFRNTFCKMGGYLGKQVVGVQNADRLYKIVDANGFRARKQDWTDLPQKIYETREIEMTALQIKHYRELKNDLYTKIQDHEIDAPMMITAMMKMQQVTSGFIMAPDGAILDLEPTNPKLNVTLETLEQIEGKVLIFCVFRRSVALLMKQLENRAVQLVGDMPTSFIAEALSEFNGNPRIRYMVCQVQTGMYGHTLLGGGECSTTIFYENSYSLNARIQAEDRNHRFGQQRSVVYIDLVASPLDRVIIKALQKKIDIANAVVDNIKG
jgi:SNF2 family DNA or RNA helicase